MGERAISTTTIAMLSFAAPPPLERRRELADLLLGAGASGTAPFGDGVEAMFPSAAAALDGTAAAQAWSCRTGEMPLRAGIATGDVEWDGAYCHGSAVRTASRLAEQAGCGEILVSHVVALLVDGARPMQPIAPIRLRGSTRPLDVDRVDWEGGPTGGLAEAHQGSCAVPLDGVPVHLTRREADVLALVATGLGNRAIADRLFISPNTVANHIRSILAKIGCDNRTEATVYAVRHGLAGE